MSQMHADLSGTQDPSGSLVSALRGEGREGEPRQKGSDTCIKFNMFKVLLSQDEL